MTADPASANVPAAPVRKAPKPGRNVGQHGHSLVAKLLPEVTRTVPHGYLIEIGTTREKLPGQGSTVLLAKLAGRLGLPFVTVDMDPANTDQARRDLASASGVSDATAVTARGEEFLASFGKPIVAAYLDAFDIQHGKHSAYREERYRTFLGTDITNDAASAMHLACAQALLTRVVPGGLVVIDDTWREGDGFGGKGRDAVPALLAGDFHIVREARTAIALQRELSPAGRLRRFYRRVRASVGRRVRHLRSMADRPTGSA